MKAIIEGKRYDTLAPRTVLVCRLGNDLPSNDFSAWDAGLYRTQSGRWFLAGWGGPMTQFGHGSMSHGGRSGGSRIIPLTREEAREYLEEDGEAVEALETYAAEFGIKEA